MEITIAGFSEILSILKELAAGVKSAAQVPENIRKEMRTALADTAELIDETLTILKQHLTAILSELMFGDQQKAKQLIYGLGSQPDWENKFRQFQLCDSLRDAAFSLENKGLYQAVARIAVNDPKAMQQKMWDYIGGEQNAAISVANMLKNLSQLAFLVDTDKEGVVQKLEKARDEVAKWRQIFIDLEVEIRGAI